MTEEIIQVSKMVAKRLEKYCRRNESWNNLFVRLMDAADNHDPFWNSDE